MKLEGSFNYLNFLRNLKMSLAVGQETSVNAYY